MPEYHLPMGSFEDSRAFNDLDSFTQGYIEAMFFTSASGPDDGDLEDASFAELAPCALEKIVADCAAFQTANADLLAAAYDTCIREIQYDAECAGHDYWLTRNGHGVGYWDRGLGDIGDALSTAAGRHELNLYRGDDDLIYLD